MSRMANQLKLFTWFVCSISDSVVIRSLDLEFATIYETKQSCGHHWNLIRAICLHDVCIETCAKEDQANHNGHAATRARKHRNNNNNKNNTHQHSTIDGFDQFYIDSKWQFNFTLKQSPDKLINTNIVTEKKWWIENQMAQFEMIHVVTIFA